MTTLHMLKLRGLPDKGGLRGVTQKKTYIPYNKNLTEKARENRKNPTPAEKKLWFDVLQNKRLSGLKFTRQKPLDEYIVDFYCSELMLVIEVDGESHASQQKYDESRTERLGLLGIEIIRYTNTEVLANLEGVYRDLLERVSKRGHQLQSRPQPPKSPLSGGLASQAPMSGGLGQSTQSRGRCDAAKL